MSDTNTLSLLDDLIAFGDLKVWSVLVTLFGDMASAEGTYIAGPTLTLIAQEIGIKPEALRVALHRLRKDGWLITDKNGRTSRHRLSPSARTETLKAAGHIYAAEVPPAKGWSVVIPDPVTTDIPAEWLPVGPSAFLARDPSDDRGALVGTLSQGAVPAWVAARLVRPEITMRYRALHGLLSGYPVPSDDRSPLARLTLRLLVLHHWRRTALQHPADAAALMGPDWSGALCRKLVHAWLTALPKPDLQTLT